MSLEDAFGTYLPRIETELEKVTRASSPDLTAYYGMMRYHVGLADESLQPAKTTSGKRLRPMLCLLCCEAAGGDPELALPAATAVELIHNFSLVHDDIEDVSHFRRGRRAVWDIWGQAHGINVGDGLFVLARLTLHGLVDRGLPLDRCQAVTMALDRACLSLCEGQYLDMSFEERTDVHLDQYLEMIRKKTASLLAGAAQSGAIIANGSRALIDAYHQFALNLGLAFQIQDDILGIWGDEQVTGKSAATDIRDRKKTLPIVYAISDSHWADDASELAELYGRNSSLDGPAVSSVLAILDRIGARQYAEESAERYYNRALDSLSQTGTENAALSHLRELAASLLGREA